jgi:adenylate kinase family enzyme
VRIAIIGNSGSGKSTLAKQLSTRYALASLDLDAVAWEPGKIAVPRDQDQAVRDVDHFCSATRGWVVEGCYGVLIEAALRHAPLLLFLEPGVESCVVNCRSRPWEPHKYGSKLEQDEKLEFLLAWVQDYYARQGDLSLVAHQSLFASYQGPKRMFVERIDEQALADLLVLVI